VKVCATCGREFPDNQKFCPADGSALRAKSASADLVGQIVADRYHILKKLGEGGMGAVYLGEHVKMGRKSAIKVMAAAMSQDPDAISRFNREASNASRISHPNVCQIYDFGETPDGLIYLAMEFIEGKSLKDIVEEAGALPAQRAATIIRQAADALQAAHDLGIVHRDIKPDNIMVVQGRDGADIVKVVDFGIARAVGGDEPGQKVTKTGLVVGTPEYMSPEQLSGDKLDGRSDIYSLALVFYRMLTGTLPFQADSAQETMIKRLTDDPLPLEAARPDISFPPKLQLVLNTALARAAAERYQASAEFGRDALDAVAGMGPPPTRVDLGQQGATQLMDKEQVAALTSKQEATRAPAAGRGAPPARTKSEPASAVVPRRSAMPLVAGGIGIVGILVGVAVVMMNRSGGGHAQQLATADTVHRATPAPAPPPDSAKTTTPATHTATPANPGTTRSGPPPRIDSQRAVSTPATGGGVDVSVIEDSANAAVQADQNSQGNVARRLARWVYYRPNATPKQKADMAELIATQLSEDDTAGIAEWARNGLQYATGQQRSRLMTMLQSVGARP